MARIDYVEAIEQLRSEGYGAADIEAAFNSLSETGMQTSDEDGPLSDDELTVEELGVVRDQLVAAAGLEDHSEPRGPGRPEIGRMVNVRMPQNMIDGLDVAAEKSGLSRAGVVRRTVSRSLGLSMTPRP
jgi:hypothetical protein